MKANCIITFGVHQLRPKVLAILSNLDDILKRCLYEAIQEVNQVIIVTIEEDVRKCQVTMAEAYRNQEIPVGSEDLF